MEMVRRASIKGMSSSVDAAFRYAEAELDTTLAISEEEEFFRDTRPKMMTAEKRKRQRHYFVAEDEWRTCELRVFFPVGPLKQTWDFIIMNLVIYACVVMPYRAIFEDATGGWYIFEDVIMLFIFLLDVVLSFNTAYLDGEIWVCHRPRICKRYMQSWFWIDFPSSIPVEFILESLDREGNEYSQLLPAVRLLRLFRLLRLVRLIKLGKFVKKVEDETGYSLSALRIVNTVIVLAVFCHVLACVFYLVATQTNPTYLSGEVDPAFPKTWITYFDNGYITEPDTPVFDAYIIAFLWAIGLVCGQNTNVTPESMSDRIVSIFVYLLATLFFAYILAVVDDQLDEVVNDPRARKLGELQTFCRFHKFGEAPNGLEKRLRHYYTNYYQSRSMVDEDDLIHKLTPSLRDEVMDHLLKSTVRLCPLLHPPGIDEDRVQTFQEEIYTSIRPVAYEAKEVVLMKNVRSSDLFFLNRGQVNAVLAGSTLSLERTLFPITQVGSFFGEQCLLGEASEVNFLAATRTDVLCVPQAKLIEAANAHLDDNMRLLLAESIWDDIRRKAMLRVWGMRIAFAEMLEEHNQTTGHHHLRPRTKHTLIASIKGNREIIAMLIQYAGPHPPAFLLLPLVALCAHLRFRIPDRRMSWHYLLVQDMGTFVLVARDEEADRCRDVTRAQL